MFVHEQEERHGSHVFADSLELEGNVGVRSVKEEGVHVDDVLVRRHLA